MTANSDREREVSEAFVTLATKLAEGFDVVDLLDGLTADCTRLLDVASAGLLLADRRGILHLMASSSERTHELELFQLQRAEGPCLECFRIGAPVMVASLSDDAYRWPQFAAGALEAGFRSVHALPMRLHDNILGTLGLFGTSPGVLNAEDLRLGQALADVASVAIVQDRLNEDSKTLNQQLQHALDSRVVIEQAKGILAERGGLDMHAAFTALRSYSRDHNRRLAEIAIGLTSRRTKPEEILAHVQRRPATSRTDS